MKKQFIAKVLVLAMVLAMVPVTVLAASAAGSNLGYGNYGYYSIGKDTNVVNTPIKGNAIDVSSGSAVVNDSIIASLADLLEDGEIVLDLQGDVDNILFTCSAKALAKLAADTGADLVLKTSFATITIPNDLLADLGNAGTMRMSISKTDTGASVYIEVAGDPVDTSSIKVEAIKADAE